MRFNPTSRCSLYIVIAVLLCLPSVAVAWEENPKIGELFKRAQTEGTCVLYDVTDKKFIG